MRTLCEGEGRDGYISDEFLVFLQFFGEMYALVMGGGGEGGGEGRGGGEGGRFTSAILKLN